MSSDHQEETKNFCLPVNEELFRIKLLGLTLLLVCIVCSCTTSSLDETSTLKEFEESLNKEIPDLMKRYDVPGLGIAVVRDGEVIWKNAFGYADRENNRKLSTDALFRVESISKSVTAWGVMRLAEQGQINLNAPIQQYLDDWNMPETEYPERDITVSQLLSHTAGLSLGTIGEEYPPDSAVPSLREYLSREFELIQSPGSGFNYSNTGFNLLQLLIEEVTGRDFADYMSDQVLLPLDMRQSTFAWDDSLFSLVPLGYDSQGKPVPPYVYPAAASGGLLATLDDVARFASAGLQRAKQQLLQSESLRKMYAPRVYDLGMYKAVTDAYGFGHFIEYFPDRTKAVWHGGQGHGWMTHFHAVPNADAAIVILTNSQRSWPVISRILIDWANWNGIASIKMGRIVLAAKIIWGFNIFVALVVLIQCIRLIHGLSTGIRRWAFSSIITSMKRIISLALSLSIIALLTWSLFQPYLMVTSVFPIASYWTGIIFWIASIVLLIKSLTNVEKHPRAD